jgi:fucose permease
MHSSFFSSSNSNYTRCSSAWFTGFGFNVFFVNLIGAFSAPVIVGVISDNIGLRTSMLFLPILAIVAVLLFLARNIYIFDKKRINFLLMSK